MSGQDQSPDLTAGVAASAVPKGGMLVGHVGDEKVLLARRGGELFAVSAKCTHYGGPLGEGLIVGHEVRCPWHHARFDLVSGAAVGAPALDPVSCWRVVGEKGRLYVRERAQPEDVRRNPKQSPASVVIVGGGAAGDAAAEMLRQEGYDGPVTILSADPAPPCDRPNLSKGYLAGTAQADWIPLRDDKFYREHEIQLRLHTEVATFDPDIAEVRLADGEGLPYGALLLAMGAEPKHLPTTGAELGHVHYLRTQADSESLIAAVEGGAERAVVVGASFIGLEVAASLRQRGLEVHVVGPEARPLERIMGPAIADFIRELHESKGEIFHLERNVASIASDGVILEDGQRIAADLVVVGIGVQPRTRLAEAAHLRVDQGVIVNRYLETSAPNVYAAGDIARWPDPASGERIRVEHWVVAQRQGQTAARNMLGVRIPFTDPPFFWSKHHDVSIRYVGHAAHFDRIDSDGDPAKRDFSARFIQGGRTAAVATIFRDVENLEAEVQLEERARQAL